MTSFPCAGQIVGTVALDRRSDTTAELRRMSVTEKARGKGVGKLLLFALESFAEEKGYTQVYLTTTTAQQPAMNMYEKAGFARECSIVRDWLGSVVEVKFVKSYPPHKSE